MSDPKLIEARRAFLRAAAERLRPLYGNTSNVEITPSTYAVGNDTSTQLNIMVNGQRKGAIVSQFVSIGSPPTDQPHAVVKTGTPPNVVQMAWAVDPATRRIDHTAAPIPLNANGQPMSESERYALPGNAVEDSRRIIAAVNGSAANLIAHPRAGEGTVPTAAKFGLGNILSREVDGRLRTAALEDTQPRRAPAPNPLG